MKKIWFIRNLKFEVFDWCFFFSSFAAVVVHCSMHISVQYSTNTRKNPTKNNRYLSCISAHIAISIENVINKPRAFFILLISLTLVWAIACCSHAQKCSVVLQHNKREIAYRTDGVADNDLYNAVIVYLSRSFFLFFIELVNDPTDSNSKIRQRAQLRHVTLYCIWECVWASAHFVLRQAKPSNVAI